jgi:predicted nucleic acid-binding protein
MYLLDANVFIEAAKRYYAFDLVPQFWTRLIEQEKAGRLCSIDRIRDELRRGKDRLAQWASTDFSEAFRNSAEAKTIKAYSKVMNWVQEQPQLIPAAKDEFARCADGWLVAYAIAHACTVVTHEVFDANTRRRVKIPNVCRAFDIQYVDTYAMLRRLGIQLV